MEQKYTLYDTIAGEKLSFEYRYQIETEAQRRLYLHRNGYPVRRNYVPGCDAILEVNDRKYTIKVKEQ